MNMLEGVSTVANFITVYEKSQIKPDSYFLIRSVFFVSKCNLLDVYFTQPINSYKILTGTKHYVFVNIFYS